MPNLTKPGTYAVKVDSAVIKMNPHVKEDPKAFNIVFKLETPDGYHCWHEMSYNKKVIAKGRNEGKTWADVAKLNLAELGVEDGYLGNLQAAIDRGIEGQAVLDYDEYVDAKGVSQRKLKVKFFNPPRSTIDLKDANWTELLGQEAAPAATPAEPAKTEDDIPMAFPDDGSAKTDGEEVPF